MKRLWSNLHLYALIIKNNYYQRKCCLVNLVKYVDQTWFNSTIWTPKDICCFKRLVRTNNDVEGYHRRLNMRCGAEPPIYRLLEVLCTEARLVDITCKLVTSETVSVERRKNTRDVQAKLLNLWEDYENGSISRKELLNSAADYTPF